jgi:predicted lipoprotein with Yx(FWY)xxD motif
MKGRAAATVPAVSAMPLAAASGCPGRTISSVCARTTSGALSAGIPVHIGSAAPGSAAAATVTATVHFSKLRPILDDAKARTLYFPEATKSTTPTGDGACAFAWPTPLNPGTRKPAPFAGSNLISTSKRSNGITQVTYTGHPLHCFAGDTTAGDTNGEETSASGATVVRRKRIRQQGRTRLMGD